MKFSYSSIISAAPDGHDYILILGHSGFLDYFTANFDGENGILTLTPNAELPIADSPDPT